MITRDELRTVLAQLRFNGMSRALDAELDRAEREASPAPELIHRLLIAEAAYRRERTLAYRLDQARLPWRWTLDTLPFLFSRFQEGDRSCRLSQIRIEQAGFLPGSVRARCA